MPRPLESVTSRVAPLLRVNVDTDQIVPKQFLKRTERTGFGRYLFYAWRYEEDGVTPRASFELNDPALAGARILAAGDNFGCGSSREHAVWALADYGFDVVIAPSFADIFLGNCAKNGVLALALERSAVERIAACAEPVTVDVRAQTVSAPRAGLRYSFEIGAHTRRALLEGLDEIALTLEHAEKIAAFEEQRGRARRA